jgi:peptidylprolyl isomerase
MWPAILPPERVLPQEMGEPINVTEDGKITKVIIREGTGAQPEVTDKVKVHYEGRLQSDGTVFDSSRERNESFVFEISGEVIEGWKLGIPTMKVGEIAEFTIAPEYAYGEAGSPPKIPENATLIFNIELMEIIMKFREDEEVIADGEKLCLEGAATFREGNLEGALKIYEDARDVVEEKWSEAMYPIQMRVYGNLSVVYGRLGRWKDSLTYAKKVLEKDEKDLKGTVRNIEALIHLDELDEARKTLEKAVHSFENNPVFSPLRQQLEAAEKERTRRQTELYKKMVGKQ